MQRQLIPKRLNSDRSYISPIVLPGRGISRKIRCPIIQSPLAGVTDQIFRQLVRKWAPEALLFTEMVNATSLELGFGSNKMKEIEEEKGPIGVQIFDHRPDAMIKAAQKAEASGAFLIDINMGCPVKKIAKKGGGSGLIREPKLAEKIVKNVCDAVKIPVTVKTRLGWCEETADPIAFARRMQDAGAQMITMHGRTRKQGFSGNANWEAIAQIKSHLDIPIIANGDITNVEEAIKCFEITNADGLMVGRGSLGSPWLVGQIYSELRGQNIIKTPTAKMKIKLSLEHLEKLLSKKGDHGLLIARKHLSWTCKGFAGSAELRKNLLRAQTPQEAIRILEKELIKN